STGRPRQAQRRSRRDIPTQHIPRIRETTLRCQWAKPTPDLLTRVFNVWHHQRQPRTASRPDITPEKEGDPRTRQSLLILAAFRPWGGSQGGRRGGPRSV